MAIIDKLQKVSHTAWELPATYKQGCAFVAPVYIILSLPCGGQKGTIGAVDSLFLPLSMKRPANIAVERKGLAG